MLSNIIRTAKKPVVATSDPYFSNVSLLLHMDGTNASTSFVDSGPNALAVTAAGNAQISTTQSKFGGASGYFDGTGDYLTLTDSTRFNFGSGDWTVEFWFYNSNSANQNKCLIALNDNNNAYAGIRVYYWNNNTIETLVSSTGTSWAVIANTAAANSVSKNVWNHYAVVRTGNIVKIFLNGVQYIPDKALTGSVFASSAHFIGSLRVSGTAIEQFNGYIDDLRITKGVARYTANFTPPAAPYPNLYNPNTTLPVSGAALWLDASQQNTLFTDAGTTPVTTSGQSVYQWNDLSGNNRHAVQATSGNRPTWNPPASGQNGLGVISFGGTSIGMTGPWANFDPLSLYVVFKWSSGYFASRIFTQSDNSTEDTTISSGSQSYIPLTVTNSPSLPSITSYYPASASTTSVTQGPGSAFTSGAWVRICHKRSGTSIGNSVNAGTASSTAMGSTVTKAISQYILGRRFLGTDQSISGSYAEVIAYNSILSSTDEAKVVAYLQAKWGTL